MVTLDGASLTLDDLAAIAEGTTVRLDADARQRVAAARVVVDEFAHHDDPTYGINTGFGDFAEVRIAPASLAELQVNLLRSHAAGVGEPLAPAVVRATMALRANVLAKGFSGIRVATLELLIEMINRGVVPVVPSRGSVGASGDLAPLAHLALVLIGEGEAFVERPVTGGVTAAGQDSVTGGPIAAGDDSVTGGPFRPTLLSGASALTEVGLQPIRLEPKEGLALINGTQPSTALLGLALHGAERLARAADVAAALSIDGLQGSTTPFDPRIHAARPFPGQATAAANLARLLADSGINAAHANCGRVQDAYSMRCAPQVHGAARDVFAHVRRVFDVEANAATDNPMVFADTREIISGGNFHGAPVSIAADQLCLGLAQLATISERRSDRLVNPASSGLPAFLTRHGGLQSGLMMAQVTAAALTSELKTLAHPASVDTIPTSGNREDHVSMSMAAGLKATRALELARSVIAIELLCAAQALDLLAPLTSSPSLMRVHDLLRQHVPTLAHDRSPAPDIARITALVARGELDRACAGKVN
ncbi:MAG TPA: histidine ammonia-lyase [Vicinamibacterales bacterium]|nr:histidine ammonia-lyase [Vicinamibacterales bacterium]